jgi:hypothetical protein
MKILYPSFLVLALTLPTADAAALCGDVTGDDARSASDALAVLRAAVGQQVDLVCKEERPSRLQYYNDFTCNSGSSVSEARFNGLTFEADAGEVSGYQVVDRDQVDSIELDVCGGTFTFPGPINLPRNREITFFMALLDPDFYEFPGIDVPAQIVFFDDGARTDLRAGGAETGVVGKLYGGRVAR